MIGSVSYQAFNWINALARTLICAFMLPFSRSWRKRLTVISGLWSNPFWAITTNLSDLVGDPLEVRVVPVKSLAHNTSEFELLCLGTLVAQLKPNSVFEIGTFDGRTTRTLAANAPAHSTVFTLNLPPGIDTNQAGIQNVDSLLNVKVLSGFRFIDAPESPKIAQLFGDSAHFDFSTYLGTMDLVFIDGSHTEAYVRSDTEAAIKMISPEGGLVVWHDAPLYGVVHYLSKQIRSHRWPIRWIEGTTLAIGWVRDGIFLPLPFPLPSKQA